MGDFKSVIRWMVDNNFVLEGTIWRSIRLLGGFFNLYLKDTYESTKASTKASNKTTEQTWRIKFGLEKLNSGIRENPIRRLIFVSLQMLGLSTCLTLVRRFNSNFIVNFSKANIKVFMFSFQLLKKALWFRIIKNEPHEHSWI